MIVLGGGLLEVLIVGLDDAVKHLPHGHAVFTDIETKVFRA